MRALSFASTSLLIVLTLAVARGEGGGEVGAQYEDEYDYHEDMPYDNMHDNAEDHEMPMTVKFANEFPDKVSFGEHTVVVVVGAAGQRRSPRLPRCLRAVSFLSPPYSQRATASRATTTNPSRGYNRRRKIVAPNRPAKMEEHRRLLGGLGGKRRRRRRADSDA